MIIYVTWKAIKGSAMMDDLVNNTIDDYKSLDFKFPDKEIMEMDEEEIDEMYFDGAVNHYRRGIKVVILSLNGRQFPMAINFCF